MDKELQMEKYLEKLQTRQNFQKVRAYKSWKRLFSELPK